MICSGASQEVGNQSSGLRDPLLVARLCLESIDHLGVLVVVGSVGSGYGGNGTGMVPSVRPIGAEISTTVAIDFGGAIGVVGK